LNDSESDLVNDVRQCNKRQFERHAHQMQDYYSHYSAGYRTWTLGHALSGTRPDDTTNTIVMYFWHRANQRTKLWVEKWGRCCCRGGDGTWRPFSPQASECSQGLGPENLPQRPMTYSAYSEMCGGSRGRRSEQCRRSYERYLAEQTQWFDEQNRQMTTQENTW